MELFYASEVFSNDNDHSEYRDCSTVVAINAVQPIDLRLSVSAPDLHRQLLLKLKEIFYNQFPDDVFCRNKYRIENWPSNVNLLKPRWTKRELEEINEGIPFYIFVLSKAYNPMHRMENTGFIKNNMSKKETLKFLLDRYKTETGRSNAKRIEWKMLDRSKIPKKSGNILSLKLIYENREIIDNIHFFKDSRSKQQTEFVELSEMELECLHYALSNDDVRTKHQSEVSDRDISCKETTKEHSDSIDYPEKPILEFSEVELEYLDYVLSNDDVSFDQNKDESQHFTTEDSATLQITMSKSFANYVDSIEFSSPTSRKKAHLAQRKRDEKISKSRNSEDPDSFGVEFPFPSLTVKHGNNSVGLSEFESKRSERNCSEILRKKRLILLERYREETGDASAKLIYWHRLDRRSIPSKYDNIIIDCYTIKTVPIYGNPEIFDNIHFFANDSAKDQIEQTSYSSKLNDSDTFNQITETETASVHDSIESEVPRSAEILQSDSDSVSGPEIESEGNECNGSAMLRKIRSTLLKRYREETGNTSAKSIYWDRLDRRAIPSKYDNIQIDRFTIKTVPIYANPEIFDNIHFFKKAISKRLTKHPDSTSPLTNEEARLILLKRYREETNDSYATQIFWKRLDRRAIPAKYDDIQIDIVSCSLKKIYRNPEIFDNIHFSLS